MSPAVDAARSWRPPRLIENRWLRGALLGGAAAYLLAALLTLEIDAARIVAGLPRAGAFLAAFLRPDFASHWGDIAQGLLESLAMTVVATVLGVALSIPIALGAARTVAPLPVYLACRSAIGVSRSFHEVIVAILFVKMVGFGPLAGVLTLVFATIGFLAKLLAEAIESLDPAPIEAVRSTGATRPQVLAFGLLPQVLPRLVGLSIYRLDINFRESAVIGVVGAGGIGATLNTSFGRYEYQTTAAILLLIIGIVLAGELVSGRVRRRLV